MGKTRTTPFDDCKKWFTDLFIGNGLLFLITLFGALIFESSFCAGIFALTGLIGFIMIILTALPIKFIRKAVPEGKADKNLAKKQIDGRLTRGYQPEPNSKLSDNPPKGGSGLIVQKSRDLPLDESFWKLREDVLNAHLKELGVEEKISLQTPDERTQFIEMLKDFEREDTLDQRKEEIKKLDIADKDILLVKNEDRFTCERIHRAIKNFTGKKVFVISLQEPAELVKLSSEVLDQIGLQKKEV